MKSNLDQIVHAHIEDITSYAAMGGCSCKLPAGALAAVCSGDLVEATHLQEHIIDDAAILPLGNNQVLVSSLDFQNPIVPDAELSGKIAALNALSDVFACGVQPLWAEVILALPKMLPIDRQIEVGQEIMRGIASACMDTGCHIVGGHTVVMPAPIIGLSVKGVASRATIKLKSGAIVGDDLILTKSIGTGIAVAARQAGSFIDTYWTPALDTLLLSNKVGAILAGMKGVHAMTDVTGFGLVGHACEVAKASGIAIEIDYDKIPVFAGTNRAVMNGFSPDLTETNLAFALSQHADLHNLSDVEKAIISDPQSNGGLFISVASNETESVLKACLHAGHNAVRIGCVRELAPNMASVFFKKSK
jgi:selenide,water dikinase